MLLSGLSGPQIAKELGVSHSNVRALLSSARGRIGVDKTLDLIHYIVDRSPTKYPREATLGRLHRSWAHAHTMRPKRISLRQRLINVEQKVAELALVVKELNPGWQPDPVLKEAPRQLS